MCLIGMPIAISYVTAISYHTQGAHIIQCTSFSLKSQRRWDIYTIFTLLPYLVDTCTSTAKHYLNGESATIDNYYFHHHYTVIVIILLFSVVHVRTAHLLSL